MTTKRAFKPAVNGLESREAPTSLAPFLTPPRVSSPPPRIVLGNGVFTGHTLVGHGTGVNTGVTHGSGGSLSM